MLACLGVDLVRIVGREHVGLITGDPYGFGDAQFFAFATDKDPTVIDVAQI